jgi:hypothetical protein
MGSWNGTCGVSHMPIMHGDKISLIFLTNPHNKNRQDTGHCSSNHLWSPCLFPLYGEYNDYGSIENYENNWHTQYILDKVRSHDYKNKIENMDVLLKLMQNSCVDLHLAEIMKPCGFDDNHFGFMMVHRNIYDLLSESAQDWASNFGNLDTLVKNGKNTYNLILNKYNEISEEARISMRFGGTDIHDGTYDFFNPIRSLLTNSDLIRISSYGSAIRFNEYVDLLWEKIGQNTPVIEPIVENIISEYCKFWLFNLNFTHLRRSYMPQSSAGSQDTSFDLYLKLNRAIADKIQDYEDEWDKDE